MPLRLITMESILLWAVVCGVALGSVKDSLKTCTLSAVAIRPRNSSLGLEPKRPSRIVFGSPCAISDSRRELTEMETATLEVKNVDEMLFVENLDMLLRSEERCG